MKQAMTRLYQRLAAKLTPSMRAVALTAAILTLGVFLTILFGESVLAGNLDNLKKAAGARLSEQGANYLKEHWIPESTDCKKISDIGGWYWAVTYQDGFAVFNCFRKCRGTYNTASYFLGLATKEDCDSWYKDRAGNQYSLCFPRDAQTLVSIHGPVIAVQRLSECRE